ncbi:MAG: hypothetical protein H7Y88_12660 [Phycisphaerales bacterium]|nr:hypothetical protein [Phycisphaerales bacterium]
MVAAIGAPVLVLSACASDPREGYSFSKTFADDIHTVHVPIFENTTFSRGIEVELSDAIVKEIQRSTPWRISTGERSSATLSGEITDSSMRTISVARDSGLVQELAVTITVDFEFIDNRTGKLIAGRKSFSASDTFVPALGVGDRMETGENATIQRLARDIVAELRSVW